jgi:hypothetical protein
MSNQFFDIKNWDTYQSRMSNKGSWIKDANDQAADPEYQRLTMFQRAVLQECRRLRSRFGKPIPYDPNYVASAASVLPKDRIRLWQALHKLVASGFLVICKTDVSAPQDISKTDVSAQEPLCHEQNPTEIRGQETISTEKKPNEKRRDGAVSRRIPFSSEPPAGATAKLTDEDTGKHIGWKIGDERFLFEGATCQ